MNRFLLQIAAKKDLAPTAMEGTREASAQALVKEQMYNLVMAFLNKESLMGQAHSPPLVEVKLFERWTSLVRDLFAAFDMIPEEQLALMSWLDPALMPCIATNTESIRLAIQKLTKKLHASIPPTPPPPLPPTVEVTSTTVVEAAEEDIPAILPEEDADASLAVDTTTSPPNDDEDVAAAAPVVESERSIDGSSSTVVVNQEEEEKEGEEANLTADS